MCRNGISPNTPLSTITCTFFPTVLADSCCRCSLCIATTWQRDLLSPQHVFEQPKDTVQDHKPLSAHPIKTSLMRSFTMMHWWRNLPTFPKQLVIRKPPSNKVLLILDSIDVSHFQLKIWIELVELKQENGHIADMKSWWKVERIQTQTCCSCGVSSMI